MWYSLFISSYSIFEFCNNTKNWPRSEQDRLELDSSNKISLFLSFFTARGASKRGSDVGQNNIFSINFLSTDPHWPDEKNISFFWLSNFWHLLNYHVFWLQKLWNYERADIYRLWTLVLMSCHQYKQEHWFEETYMFVSSCCHLFHGHGFSFAITSLDSRHLQFWETQFILLCWDVKCKA